MKREYPDRKKGNDDKEGSSKSTNVVEEQVSESSDGDMLSVSSSSEHLMDSGFSMFFSCNTKQGLV